MATINSYSFITKKNNNITIRNCEDSDLSGIHLFLNSIANDSTHTMMLVGRNPPPQEKIKIRWDTFKTSEKGLVIGAFNNEKIIGQLLVDQDWEGHPWAKHTAVFAMFIAKDYWSEGLGKEFLNLLDSHAKKMCLTRIEAHVRTTNERAIALYLKCGYQVEGLRKKAALINGKYQDEYYIGKIYE